MIKKLFSRFMKKEVRLTDSYILKILSPSADQEITNPYPQHTAFFAAVRSKARNIAQVPFRIFRGDIEVTDDNKDPVGILFRIVNPYYSKYDLWEAIVTCLEIWGEAFVIKDRETYRGVPVALWPQVPTAFKEKTYNDRIVAWEFMKSGTSVMLYPEEVIQIKYYNPYNYFRGLSPIEGGLMEEIKLDGKARVFNKRFFENDGSLGVVYRTDQVLTDEQYQRLKQQLVESRQGTNQAFRSLLLDGGLDVKTVGATIKDMQFLELRKFTREEVAMITGVPKSELQLYEDLNYATARTSDLNYWKKTLIPLMRKIEDRINQELLKDLGYMGWFDIESTGVLNEEIVQLADAASKFYAMGVPFNVINERFDLGFPEIEEETGDIKESSKSRIAKMPKQASVPFREAFWKRRINGIAPFYAQASRKVKEYFYQVEQAILKKILKNTSTWVRKAESGEEVNLDELDFLFSDAKLGKALSDVYRSTIKYSLRDFNYPSEMEEAILSRRMNKIKGINDTARKEVKERLRQAIIDAMREGIPESERAQVIIDTVKESMDVNEHRARTIARTEVHGVFNESLWEKTKITQPAKLMWVSARDDRVRDTHKELDGEIVEYGQKFSNGLRYPMDPEGPAEEVINCRCTYIELFE